MKQDIINFFKEVNWKRFGKIALLILPVLVWTVWFHTIKFLAKWNTVINNYGDELIEEFMRD